MKRSIVVSAVIVFSFGINQCYGSDCPDCVDPSNTTCKPWSNGKAKFYWASDSEVSSDITLTAGPCGQPGETGTAYIFASVDAHNKNCNNNSSSEPCGGDETNSGTFAIINVSGNQKALDHIFPGGLSFTGNREVGYSTKTFASVTVEQTGCDYKLLVGDPTEMKIILHPTVQKCSSEFDNSKFGINVVFYQARNEDPDNFSMLARTNGSITVKTNDKTDADAAYFKPDLKDGSSIAWIEEVSRNYATGGDDVWKISYRGENQDTCSSVDHWLGPLRDPSDNTDTIPSSKIFYRVKYPSYKKDTNGTPEYADMDGWSIDTTNKRIIFDLADQGMVYYHCNRQVGNKYMVSSIERCDISESPGQGDVEWNFYYNDNDKLQYIYNGSELSDPNYPPIETKYYSYEWEDNDPNITYYSRETTSDSWEAQRQWQLEFDSEDRVVKYSSSCSSGCGSGGDDFEHVEYHPTYEDVIVKRFDSDGNTIVQNTVSEFTYGSYKNSYTVWIDNFSFEYDMVSPYTCETDIVPAGWTLDSGNQTDISVCDPNSTSVPHEDQYLRLEDAVTLSQQTDDVIWSDTIYYLEASVRSIPGSGEGSATIALYSNETGQTEYLTTMSYSGNDGIWDGIGEIWDSSGYTGTYEDTEFIVKVTGSNVDIDDIRISATTFIGNTTKPVITKKEIYNEGFEDPNLITTGEWEYNTDNYTVIEKQWIDDTNYTVKKYEYLDAAFSNLEKRIDYEELNEDPASPTGSYYTTTYSSDIALGVYKTIYPNELRADVEVRNEDGLVIEKFIMDTVTDANSNYEGYEYVNVFNNIDNPKWEVEKITNARGGVTEFSYKRFGTTLLTPNYLIESKTEPETAAGQQQSQFEYDGLMRLIKEKSKDTDGNWVETVYDYNSETGFLDSVITDYRGIRAKTWYMRNDFGQVTRQFNADDVMTGKSYGLGGELVSDFVISDTCDPNDPDSQLTLVSQTKYEYNSDGKLEYVKKAKDNQEFTYNSPDDWIVTKYEYDHLGRKIKKTEDYGTGRINLVTTFEYDLQGRLEKTTYPTGRWVKTVRDGRGLIDEEITGYSDTIVLKTVFDYDANGNITDQINPDGSSIVYEYDNYDRLEKQYMVSTEGPYTQKFYNSAGDVIRQAAFEDDETMLSDQRMTYDNLGKLLSERFCADPNTLDNSDDLVSHYVYDIAGNLRYEIRAGLTNTEPNEIPDSNDLITEHKYNSIGRRTETIDPEGITHAVTYTDAGLVKKIMDPKDSVDPDLFATENIYDSYGRVKRVIDPLGNYTENTYNSLNQVIEVVVYDCNDTETEADDIPVRQERFVYDNLGNITQQAVMADPDSTAAVTLGTDLVTDMVYNSSTGLLDEQKSYYGTSATVSKTEFFYDSIGRKYKTIDPEGNEEVVTFYSYADGNPAQVKKVELNEKDAADSGNNYTVTTFFEYNNHGQLDKKVLDVDGDGVNEATDQIDTFTYDGLGRIETQTANDGVVTKMSYDGFGNLEEKIDDYGVSTENRTTEFVYNRLNQQYQVKAYDPNDTTAHVSVQTTTYEYNKNGNVTEITYPDNETVEYTYNVHNKLDTETQRDGTWIAYWYSTTGNIVKISDYDSQDQNCPIQSATFIEEFEHDPLGNITYAYKEVDGDEVSESAFIYNGFGMRTLESTEYDDSLSKYTSWTYDGFGNILTQTHGSEVLTNTYDGLGRIETIDRGDDNIINYAYIGRNPKSIEYPEPDVIQNFAYDVVGRIKDCNSLDTNDAPILDFYYQYDEIGNRESCRYIHLSTDVWDIYEYDSLRRLSKVFYADDNGDAYARNIDYPKDLIFLADAASVWLDCDCDYFKAVQMAYRNLDEQKILAYKIDRIEKVLTEAGFTDIESFIRRIKAIDTIAYNPDAPVFAFVELGQEVPNNYQTETILDENDNILARIIYDNKDRMVLFAMYPDAGGTVVVTYEYNNKDVVTSETVTTLDTDGNVIDEQDMLAYQPAETSTMSASTTSMSLDSTSMLTMSSEPEAPESSSEEFTYDHLGNRYQHTDKTGFTTTYTHNIANQYTETVQDYPYVPDREVSYTHDDNGNLTNNEFGYGYSYDYRNRLIEVEDPNSDFISSYEFDALGRRIYKLVGNTKTYFFYDPYSRVVAEYEKPSGETAELARTFVYGNGIDEVLSMFLPERDYDPNHLPEVISFCESWLATTSDNNYDSSYDFDSDGVVDMNDFATFADDDWEFPENYETRYYYLKDALGSVVGLVGGRRQRDEEREFYLYDAYGKLSIEDGKESVSGNPYLFTGRRYDPESQLYYYRFRTYNPQLGQMHQTDPYEYIDGMNLYEYVMSNPVMYVDPWGLMGRGGPRPPIDFDKVPPSKPHKPFTGDHTHYRWYEQNPKTGKRFWKNRVKDGCPNMSLRIKMAFNNWSTHPVAGPATMGLGAGVATYLAYKNAETRFQYRIQRGLAELDDSNEKAISSYWQKQMKQLGEQVLEKEILSKMNTSCCDNIKVKKCNENLVRSLINRSVQLALGLKQAYPVDFSRGDVTDFFGTAITRQPRAA